MRKHRTFEEGFTLVELLVVVAIVGILAAMVIAKIKDSIRRANEAKTKHELRLMRDAIEYYKIDHDGNPPAVLNDLVPDYMTGSTAWTVPAENVGDGPEPGYYVYDIPSPNQNDSLTRTISGAANQGGWRYASDNGDVWIDEDGTSLIDGKEYRFW